jgi:hypothetical protein
MNMYNFIYNHVVLIMVIVEKMVATWVQIWLHDYNWTLIARCPSHEKHILALCKYPIGMLLQAHMVSNIWHTILHFWWNQLIINK